LPAADATKDKKTPAPTPDVRIEDTQPSLPSLRTAPENPDSESARSVVKPMPGADIVVVGAEQPAKNDRVDVPPPPPPPAIDVKNPPPPLAGNWDGHPKPATPTRELSSPPVPMGKEVTEKKPPAKTNPIPEPPPPLSPVPFDNLPPPLTPSTSEPPLKPQPPDTPPPSVKEGPNPDAALPPTAPSDKILAARIVPVSPTTPESAKLTPVIKKPAGKPKALPLTGTHACKVDDRHGLTLPKEVREQMGEQEALFVTLGSDHCVWLTTAAGLEKLTDRLEKSLEGSDEAKATRLRYFAQTERVAVDKAGHFVVPSALAEAAGVKQDAVLIGVGDHLELWDAQRWQKVSQTTTGGETPETSAADSHEEL
jgi:MraZ protein